MTAANVIESVVGGWGKWSAHKLLIAPNTTNVSYWESDILIIQPSGWCEEVEIKVSVSDFRAELRNKKEKHESIERGYRLVNRYDYAKRCPAEPDKVSTIIRRFWFAMPEDVYEKVQEEIPAWAGVLSIGLTSRDEWHVIYPWKEERPAKNLPARKCTDAERLRLLTSVYHRAWSNGWIKPKHEQEGLGL